MCLQYADTITTALVYTHTGRAMHACLHKQTQLPDNKLWLRNQIENVIKYDERRERGRLVCEKSTIIISVRPSGSALLGSALPALTRWPANRLRPTAQLGATTCYPRVSAYASLALISSDKSNISGEFYATWFDLPDDF